MKSAHLSSATKALKFMRGGNATFTLRSRNTGKRFTFKMRQKKGTPFFVSVLVGVNNESDFQYIGFVPTNNGVLIAGRKGKPNMPSFKALAWALDKLANGNLPDTLEIWHEGKCGACGRKLTVPESIDTGFGPICAGRL